MLMGTVEDSKSDIGIIGIEYYIPELYVHQRDLGKRLGFEVSFF